MYICVHIQTYILFWTVLDCGGTVRQSANRQPRLEDSAHCSSSAAHIAPAEKLLHPSIQVVMLEEELTT